jgi:hypothetical protein
MTFDVEITSMLGDDGQPAIRPVDVPDEAIHKALGSPPTYAWRERRIEAHAVLDLVFHYGQNDFQPLPFYSVSVGDVIRVGEGRFRVERVGFERIA